MVLTPEKRQWIFIAVVVIIVGFAFQGSRGLYETTEGRYALSAREMAESGNWLEPTLAGIPHWSKPPLTYWTIAAGLKLFGMNEWGARFFNAMSLIVTALAVSMLGTTMWDRKTGMLAGLIYATSPFPVIAAFTLNADTLVCLWEVLAILCFWKAVRVQSRVKVGYWVIGIWVFLGFGFMTKGPVALMPLLPIMAFRSQQPKRERKFPLLPPLGLFLFVILGFSWYLYEASRHPGLFEYFVDEEIIKRVATDTADRYYEWYQPIRLYLPVLLLGGGLWSYYLWPLVRRQQLYRVRTLLAVLKTSGQALFLATWLVPPLIIFSISQSRLPNYVLPIFPAIALAIARHLGKTWAGSTLPRQITLVVAISAAVLIIVKGAASYWYEDRRDMRALYRQCQPYDQPQTTLFVLFRDRKSFGLEFYLQSPVARTFSPAALLERIENERQSVHRYVFVTKHDYGKSLLEALAEMELQVKTWGNPYWLLARVEESGDQTPPYEKPGP